MLAQPQAGPGLPRSQSQPQVLWQPLLVARVAAAARSTRSEQARGPQLLRWAARLVPQQGKSTRASSWEVYLRALGRVCTATVSCTRGSGLLGANVGRESSQAATTPSFSREKCTMGYRMAQVRGHMCVALLARSGDVASRSCASVVTGTFYFGNGDRYAGQWRDGLFHGRGVYVSVSGASHDGEVRRRGIACPVSAAQPSTRRSGRTANVMVLVRLHSQTAASITASGGMARSTAAGSSNVPTGLSTAALGRST